MRTAIYVRVSTEGQASEGISLDMQETRCRERADADGSADVIVFSDDGYSGATTEGPQLQQLLSELEETDVVYVWELDRLTRSQRDFHNLLAACADADTRLVSISEDFDLGSAVGKVVASVLAAVSEFFIDWLKEIITPSLHERVVQGLTLGPPTFGYRKQTDARGEPISALPIVPEPGEA